MVVVTVVADAEVADVEAEAAEVADAEKMPLGFP
jgi:hypothetical protein